MSPPDPGTPDARALLAHAPWMRRLARTLVRDAERAEEVAQETWVRLLERPPALDRPYRGWIATVMRNLVRAERRGGARREARERARAVAHADDGHAPSSHELVERAALQRELVQAVLELAEPYRTAILLRWFEELTPTRIAARERVPLATVKTRLARGLAQLRGRLAERRGPDGRVSVLVALARLEPPVPALLSPLPVLAAMNVKLAATLFLATAAGLAAFLALRGDEPARGAVDLSEPARAPAELAGSGAPPGPPAPADDAGTREAVTAPSAQPSRGPSVEAAAAPARLTRGRVIDVRGAPVAGVELALVTREGEAAAAGATPVATSGPDGAFELADPARGDLVARDPRWTTLLAGIPVDARSGQECRVVVAPSIAVAGVVVAADGVPLAGARVALEPPADMRARLAEVLDFSRTVPFATTTDELGRFRLDPAPALDGGRLAAEAAGHAPHAEESPRVAREDVVIVLARSRAAEGSLAGIVVDATGLPVAGARVSHGIDTRLTDEHGGFAFRLDDPESLERELARHGVSVPDDVLRAVARGHLPAELRGKRGADGSVRWPDPLVLRLGGAPLAISGAVVDERGEPLAGMRVWIADPTLLGAVTGDGEGPPGMVQVEATIAGAGPGWSRVETDSDGRFELASLDDREYAVAAMDPGTLLRTVEPGIRAGRRDVELVLRRGRLFPRLAGRIVDGRGRPVSGAQVFPMCDALETYLAGQKIGTHHDALDGTRTDADGRFVLERVPRDLVYLRIQGADTIPLEWGRGLEGGLDGLAGEAPEQLVITVERRCHFQVVLSVPAEADEVGVLDAAGEPLVVSEFLGNGRRDTERHALLEGRSSTLAVGDAAASLVLYRAGAEVRRVPLALAPGEPTRLEL